MKTWQTELVIYIQRLETALANISPCPPYPPTIPYAPLDRKPSPLQAVIHRAVVFIELGSWARTRETTEAISILWKGGYISSGAVLGRSLFELWGVTRCLSDSLSSFVENNDFEKLEQKVNKIFEGVRSEVLMPWGAGASETPIHVLDAIRGLKAIYPNALSAYEDLCESAHANQPRFMEWWHLGKNGDNWTNETVQKRGHVLLERTVDAIEAAILGVKEESIRGLDICSRLY
jgi:hypothetical protein